MAQDHWYASSSYNNENGEGNGSELKPFTSLAKINNVAGNGDMVFLKRGDVFYGTLAPAGHNIQVADYGNHPNPPKISGFTNLLPNDFSPFQGNVYRCPLATRPKVITMNGSLMPLGRWPNSDAENGGYFTYHNPDSVSGIPYIEATSTSEIDNTAKEVVIRTNNYSIEAKPITQVAGNKIYYGPTTGFNGANNTFPAQDGYGYYFQNGLNTLDRHGEWYYNEDDNNLYVYFENGPQHIQVSTIDILCDLKRYSRIYISNIDFEGANRMGVDIGDNDEGYECFDIAVTNCNFNFIGVRAIHARHIKDLSIKSSSFSNCLSGAIQFYTFYYSGWQPIVKVHLCNFDNIAPWPGMAYNTDMGDNNAISSFVSYSCDIVGNRFNDIGKSAIFWQGSYVSITENNISNAVKNFADYGAIYTWMNGNINFTERTIENNVVGNCPGNKYGTPAKTPIAAGIYLDGSTRDVLVKNNTVFNMGSSGISSNNPKTVTLTGNTLYNNPNGIRCGHIHGYLPEGTNIDIKILENKIYSSRGQVNPTLLYSNNELASAISLEADVTDWQQDLQNMYCEGNAYGLTHQRPFFIEVPAGSGEPSSWISLPKWTSLANENSTQAFPARAHFMPNGQAYKIGENPINILPIYDRASIPTTTEWTNNDGSVIKTLSPHPDGYNELKVEFTTPLPNTFTPFTRTINTTLSPNRKYVFSYQIRAETNGICNSSVRKSGCGTTCTFYPTSDNIRVYTDVPVTVEYLIYVPADFTGSPVFTINIEKTSGITYLSHIKIQPYENVDVQVNDADDFVAFAYNPEWLTQQYTYGLPVAGETYEDGFGYSAINTVSLASPFNSIILFKTGLINARPHRVTPPLAPVEESISKITLYPNPVENNILIDKLNPADGWQQLDIVNAEGKIVQSQKIKANSTKVNCSVAKLMSGIYLALLRDNKGRRYTARFIKK